MEKLLESGKTKEQKPLGSVIGGLAISRALCEGLPANGIIVEAHSPLVWNQKANGPILTSIAKAHNKTVCQVPITYCLQKNWVPLPRSDTPSRIVENANVYDFELFKEGMKTLDDLNHKSQVAIVKAVSSMLYI